MFVTRVDINLCNPTTDLCAWGADQKRRRLEEEEAWAGAATAFQEYGKTLDTVKPFK